MFDSAQYTERMQKALAYMGDEFAKLQAGRATAGLVSGIKVAASYGTMPMNQVANIVVMDTSTIKIEPWDKTIASAIESAIYDADTGITPQGMGDHLLVKVPALTTERRQQIVKQVHSYAEDAKVAIRQIRQDARDDVRKLADEDGVSEDDIRGYEESIDELTQSYNTRIEDAMKEKENDILNG